MEIINAGLDFISTPEKRDTDFYSLIGTKVILMCENLDTIDVNFLHQNYKEINFTGIPYHYIIMKSGMIYLARPRVYRAGFRYSYANLFKNSICVLTEGLDSSELTAEQIASLTELLTMIVMQDNLLLSDIMSFRQVYYNVTTQDFKTLLSNVTANVAALDIYRSVGDTESDPTFRKIVAGGCIDTFDTIAKYTKVPKAHIINMNPHVALSGGIIPPRTTIFLPKNRTSGFLSDSVGVSMINMIYRRILDKIAGFKDLLESYGSEVE